MNESESDIGVRTSDIGSGDKAPFVENWTDTPRF